MERQYQAAQDHDFTFLRSANQIRRFVAAGYLVEVPGNDNYKLIRVSYPYARPEAKLFIERLSAQYRAACGEPLVVTSLTRPQTEQPRNASDQSVHPTGMALDIRRSQQRSCRAWLEDVLISLEKQGLLEATRERWPPHYHVAVYPRSYSRYVATLADRSLPDPTGTTHYEVRRGDSLWDIARNFGIDVDALRVANNLSQSRIYVGQTLRIPDPSELSVATPPRAPVHYRVQRGDSLWGIARSYGVDVDELRVANNLSTTRIYAGQTLRIPAGQ